MFPSPESQSQDQPISSSQSCQLKEELCSSPQTPGRSQPVCIRRSRGTEDVVASGSMRAGCLTS
ncbi:hypothetical protein EYF80_045640 [Liparis tanakae]|uniref:Uncharacterized protein n=1 Tax=Liparis tanakae TaxID=230148 RepID=A0A4Z2FTG9_9TELE|nr:hypothetical protein EYF80_045640 [Liparis tanakae]